VASIGWLFDPIRRAFKAIGGRLLGRRQLVSVRDTTADAGAAEMRALAGRAARGEISADAFRAGMREAIRNVHGSQYILGRGGLDAMAASDVRTLGGLLRTQYGYLDGFVRDLGAGRLSDAQAEARAAMYAGHGVGSFERGVAAAWGLHGLLPEYPGERCLGLSACRCSWSFRETEQEIECTWRTGGSDPCVVCQGNADRYRPYAVPKTAARPDRTPVRLAAVDQRRKEMA